jgi:hypothetical protein
MFRNHTVTHTVTAVYNLPSKFGKTHLQASITPNKFFRLANARHGGGASTTTVPWGPHMGKSGPDQTNDCSATRSTKLVYAV